ncbi:peroxiredoxin [Pseudorhizobium endolithicum]|uniref:thioredoxin-dependent peroxiredoxin n=1 Tax=Pseudorhizobium endolithicum TaxID=1191678 RepID=A0ABM8PRR1_9HYPH|nr:thioredoxin-dependent thiol peroxidase [Pseudorhizobium endolithicum]CAD6414707.1 peroxiredoxin [Rhizobium sp. Q54]CAD7044952.1 peroxiredoxin [Pseudorhizobium endolithicum]
MTKLNTGDSAPDFTLPRDGGGTVALRDFRGRDVVLYFYPKDDTTGCTAEAVAFTALLPQFEDAGAVVIGISPDPVAKHDKFAAKHGLRVVLASDEEKEVSQAYGVWVQKSMYGRTYMGVERSTFLIGKDGRIRNVWPKVKVAGHAEEVLRYLLAE